MRLYRGESGQTCHPIPAGRPGLFPPAGQQSRRLRGMYSRSCACGGTDAGGARLCDGVSYPPDRSDRLSGNRRKTVRKAGRDGFHSRRGAAFVEKNSFPLIKRFLFTLAGARYDRKAKCRLRRTGSFSFGRMGRSWRRLPGLLRQTTLFLKLIP